MPTITRPSPAEHAEYYSRYINLVPEGDILRILETQKGNTTRMLSEVGEEKTLFRYAPGKWSLKEVVGHVIDAERVFAFRAFAITRDSGSALPGMDQEIYAAGANYATRRLADIVDEFRDVRKSSIVLFSNFSEEMFGIRGTASGLEFTVRCFPYIVAGHELHHAGVLRERYLRQPL